AGRRSPRPGPRTCRSEAGRARPRAAARGQPASGPGACAPRSGPPATEPATGGGPAPRPSFPQRPKRDGVAGFRGRRDAVLPGPAGSALQHVGRARLQTLFEDPPPLAGAALEAHPATGAQRDADDRSEARRVAMQADGGPGRIALDERLDQVLRGNAGELAAPLPKRDQPLREGLSRRRAPALLVVVVDAVVASGAA